MLECVNVFRSLGGPPGLSPVLQRKLDNSSSANNSSNNGCPLLTKPLRPQWVAGRSGALSGSENLTQDSEEHPQSVKSLCSSFHYIYSIVAYILLLFHLQRGVHRTMLWLWPHCFTVLGFLAHPYPFSPIYSNFFWNVVSLKICQEVS